MNNNTLLYKKKKKKKHAPIFFTLSMYLKLGIACAYKLKLIYVTFSFRVHVLTLQGVAQGEKEIPACIK